jgi:hypothetical protein
MLLFRHRRSLGYFKDKGKVFLGTNQVQDSRWDSEQQCRVSANMIN